MAPGSLPAMPATDGPQKYPTQPYLPGEFFWINEKHLSKNNLMILLNTDFTELGIANKPDPSTFDPQFGYRRRFFYHIPNTILSNTKRRRC